MMNWNEIRDLLARQQVAALSEIRGCSDDEIAVLEHKLGRNLPRAYKEFLKAIGHDGGRLLVGTDAFYRHLPRLKPAAEELLEESQLDVSLANAFVFYMHQGYEFGYFFLGDGDDPPVYQFVEGGGTPSIAWPTFTAYVLDIARLHSPQPFG